jgi:thiamine-phosphate pyrophosphorylase
MKDASADEIISTGKRLRELCDRYNATLIIDDHVELVDKIGADGVHLGKEDMPPAEARKTLGDKAIIGGTANTFDDVKYLHSQGVDYMGMGPFRFTATKKRLSPVLGLEGYKEAVRQCKAEGIELPIVAIGGITIADVRDIMLTGVAGVAISGAILNADDPVESTREFLTLCG